MAEYWTAEGHNNVWKNTFERVCAFRSGKLQRNFRINIGAIDHRSSQWYSEAQDGMGQWMMMMMMMMVMMMGGGE